MMLGMVKRTMDLTTLSDLVTEEQFTAEVVELAGLFGWHVMHPRPARRAGGEWRTAMQGDAGFPDLVLARDGEVIVAELKTNRGRTTAAQDAWIEALGAFAEVWRPRDMDAIESRLRGPRDAHRFGESWLDPGLLGQ